jgi:hypothetical protein
MMTRRILYRRDRSDRVVTWMDEECISAVSGVGATAAAEFGPDGRAGPDDDSIQRGIPSATLLNGQSTRTCKEFNDRHAIYYDILLLVKVEYLYTPT